MHLVLVNYSMYNGVCVTLSNICLCKYLISDERGPMAFRKITDNPLNILCSLQEPIDSMTRALVLAIGVCYHAKLQHRRQDYRKVVAQSFKAPCLLPGGERQILREISRFVTLSFVIVRPRFFRFDACSTAAYVIS